MSNGVCPSSPSPVVPAPKSVSFLENLVTCLTPSSSTPGYRTTLGYRKKQHDTFSDSESDSESDDDMPAPVEPAPVVPAPVAPALVATVNYPVAPVPVYVPTPLAFDNNPDSDDESICSDCEPEHIDPSEAIHVLPPPPSPRGSDFDIKDEEPALQDTPPASSILGPPRVTPSGRPVRDCAVRNVPYHFGLARTNNTLTNSAVRKFSAFTAYVAPCTTHIGTPLFTPTPHSASTQLPTCEPQSYKKAMSSPPAS
jgi:hypothetical protein